MAQQYPSGPVWGCYGPYSSLFQVCCAGEKKDAPCTQQNDRAQQGLAPVTKPVKRVSDDFGQAVTKPSPQGAQRWTPKWKTRCSPINRSVFFLNFWNTIAIVCQKIIQSWSSISFYFTQIRKFRRKSRGGAADVAGSYQVGCAFSLKKNC